MTNLVGRQFGNYYLTHLLGRGGFAEVYLGEHLHLKTQAAIKILYAHLSNEDMQGFLTEARTIARLEHPHIVQVLSFDVQEGIPFIVMAYAPNGNLRQHHTKGTQLPLNTIISYVNQVADALQYAHGERLIHRDIKPENMLLGRYNEVLLSDFGIAVVAQSSHLQSTQEVIGTAAYMAPEQLQGKPRRASDQYSLGIVVYEWICGERPFHGSFTELYSQHLFVPPPSLYKKVPAILPDVEKVVLTALEKDPHKRFASVQAFAAALEQASQGGLSARAVLPPESTRQSQPLVQPHLVTGTSPVLSLQPTNRVTPPSQSLPPTKAVTPPAEVSSLATRESVFSGEPQLPKRRIARRTVVLSLAGLALAGGGLSLLAFSQRSKVPSPSFRSTTTTIPTRIPSPTPSAPPIGTTLLTYRGHSDTVGGVSWSPDGRLIASASNDGTAQVWNAADGSDVFTYHSSYVGGSIAWSPDGTRIASAGDATVQVWDATTGSNVLTYRGHSQAQYVSVRAISWSPDGKQIASAGDDTTVQVFDATSGNTTCTYRGHADGVYAVSWSPDGTRVASGGGKINTGYGDTAVHIWDPTTGENVLIYQGPSSEVAAIAWSPDSKRIASANISNTVYVCELNSGNTIYTYHRHLHAVMAVAWSPDGKRIASAGVDTTVQLWNAGDGSNAFTYRGHAGWVESVAWSPDGTRIASASDDKTVQIWQAL